MSSAEAIPPPSDYDFMLADKLLDELQTQHPYQVELLRKGLQELQVPHDCDEKASPCEEAHCEDGDCVEVDELERIVAEIDDTLQTVGEHHKLDIKDLENIETYDLDGYRTFIRGFNRELREKLRDKGTSV